MLYIISCSCIYLLSGEGSYPKHVTVNKAVLILIFTPVIHFDKQFLQCCLKLKVLKPALLVPCLDLSSQVQFLGIANSLTSQLLANDGTEYWLTAKIKLAQEKCG